MQKTTALLACALSTLALNGCFLFGPGQAKAPAPRQQTDIVAPAPASQDSGNQTGASHDGGNHQDQMTFIGSFSLPEDHVNKLQAANLEPISTHQGMHFRIHLSVFKDGQQLTVPANFGIVENWGVANLHTHEPNGVFDVAAAEPRDFTLGQLITAWGVDLGTAAVYVNGELVADPGAHVLARNQEIAIVFGTAPGTIPSSYDFAD